MRFGTSTQYTTSAPLFPVDGNSRTTHTVNRHKVVVTGLEPTTTYHYVVLSRDDVGNVAVSADGTFATARSGVTPPPDTSLPIISNLEAACDTPQSASISWFTDRITDAQVKYGVDASYGTTTDVQDVPSTEYKCTKHTVPLRGLKPGTTYHFRAKSKDMSGNLAVSADQTFVTPASTPKARE